MMDCFENKTLPMERCPGCRRALQAAIPVPFGHPSPWWRAAVADFFPVCGDCYFRISTDAKWLSRCTERALAWWTMDQELRAVRTGGKGPQVYMLLAAGSEKL